MAPSPVDTSQVAEALRALRTEQPLVQCLTNVVAAQWTANVLLAAGASPAMVDNPHEAGGFASVAGAVLVNTGTPYEDTVAGMRAAVEGAAAAGTPWVLDPVAVGGLAWRTEVAHELLALHAPAVVRGNASEVAALGGGTGGRGVDSADRPEDVLEAARALARRHGTVVAVSGPVDHLTDGERLVRVHDGDPVMTRVTAMGCALGALIAACTAVTEDGLVAATTATALLTVCGQRAAARCQGPGSFAVHLLDDLAALTPEELAAQVHLS